MIIKNGKFGDRLYDVMRPFISCVHLTEMSKKLLWPGYAVLMEKTRNACIILDWELLGMYRMFDLK
jgi:hypothetical protein